jgi:hypothetical protein
MQPIFEKESEQAKIGPNETRITPEFIESTNETRITPEFVDSYLGLCSKVSR